MQTGGTTLTSSVTVDSGSDRCMAVLIEGEGDGTNQATWVTSVAYGGVALTRLGGVDHNQWSWSEIWFLKSPTVGTANLVTTLPRSDAFRHTVIVGQGVDNTLTTPFRTIQTTGGGSTSGTSTTATVPSVTSDDLVISGLSVDGTGHSIAADPGGTTEASGNVGAGSNEQVISSQAGASGGVMSHTWTTSAPFSFAATAFIGTAAGGAALTKDINDTVGIADARAFDVGKAIADGVGVGDSVSSTSAFARTLNDPVAVGDSTATAAAYDRQIADPVGVSDAQILATAYVRALADGLAVSDQVTPAAGWDEVINDGVGVGDVVTPIIVLAKNIDDTVGVADALNAEVARFQAINDGVGVGDTVNTASAKFVTLADAVGMADLLTTDVDWVRALADTVGIADLLQRELGIERQITDTVAVADEVLIGALQLVWLRVRLDDRLVTVVALSDRSITEVLLGDSTLTDVDLSATKGNRK